MSYTFGGATTDDATGTTASNYGADNTSTLVCGWWYPTTLTATRGYWSAGNVFGAEVDGTTSEIRMRTDNTTDGQWLTSGAGITTDKWWFLAFLNASENTTVAGEWRVWVGDINTRPTEVTVTNPTVRSGNYTGTSTFYLGNKGTGSLAFQGDIGWACILVCAAIGTSNPFTIQTSGVISNDQAEATYRRWIEPIYLGRPLHYQYPTQGNGTFSVAHFDLTRRAGQRFQWSHGLNPNNGPLTINGATFSENQPPVCPPIDWPNTPPLRR